MYYKSFYDSPIGKLTLVSDEKNLVGLWMEGQKYYESTLPEECPVMCMEDFLLQSITDMNTCAAYGVLQAVKVWLDQYFAGEKPQVSELPLAPVGSIFRQQVWKLMCEIPYGEVVTYGELARRLAVRIGRESMSAQAIGGAVGHNPISIIIPCHRVVGANGSLTGYAGGIERKARLLEMERIVAEGKKFDAGIR